MVDNGVLQEVHIERARARGLVGNIYKGKVVRILPGMQAAFIEAGLERTAFLHAADIVGKVSGSDDGNGGSDASPEIRELLHDGQALSFRL